MTTDGNRSRCPMGSRILDQFPLPTDSGRTDYSAATMISR